jgi:hypothetical protein
VHATYGASGSETRGKRASAPSLVVSGVDPKLQHVNNTCQKFVTTCARVLTVWTRVGRLASA